MLKNISDLGRILSKEEQQSIHGGTRICDCNLGDPIWDPGCDEYRCM